MTSHVHQGKIFPSQSGHLVFPRYRADIDGLRGVAVLSVVGFHAFPAWVKGGFIGVDIFFVISGFLISTIIFKSLERNSFSFVEFYSRRIRRIFPALLVVLVACYLFGWFALLAGEYKQLGKHIAASAGFVSNFVLWNESGYFDPASETKPLLHLWSLGIEEQFYIVWPLLLWVAWKKRFNFLAITIAAGIISFALNLTNYRSDGVANFYSPQTRFWELFVGSLLAYIAHHNIQFMGRYWVELDRLLGKVVWAQAPIGALLIATSLMVITKGQPFPGTWATLPVLGAVLIIGAGADAWVNRIILSNRVLVWIGLISFPIYLWHWPLLSFARIIESGVPDRSIRAASVVVSIILAWLTYKLVEHHFRFGNRSKAHIYFLAVSMIFFGSVGYFTYEQNGLPFGRSIPDLDGVYSQIVWTNDDRSDVACQKHFGKTYSYCKLASDKVPTVALIGDSFANSYFLGLSIEYNNPRSAMGLVNRGPLAKPTCSRRCLVNGLAGFEPPPRVACPDMGSTSLLGRPLPSCFLLLLCCPLPRLNKAGQLLHSASESPHTSPTAVVAL